jgi:hypothetical protein
MEDAIANFKLSVASVPNRKAFSEVGRPVVLSLGSLG